MKPPKLFFIVEGQHFPGLIAYALSKKRMSPTQYVLLFA